MLVHRGSLSKLAVGERLAAPCPPRRSCVYETADSAMVVPAVEGVVGGGLVRSPIQGRLLRSPV